MDPVAACAQRGGVATYAELSSSGVARRALAAAVASGDVFRIATGVYALPTASRLARAEAVHRGTRTCITALAAHGLPHRTVDSRLHLAIPASSNHGRSSRDLRLHWYAGPIADAGTILGAIDVASLCLADVDQLAAIDAALNRGLIAPRDLDHLTVTPSSRAAWLRCHCDDECQSPPETFVRVAMREVGLPVRTQVQVSGVGRVDFLVDDAVIIEVDGKTYHMNERAFWEDRRRDRVAQVGGLMVLRFTREDVERDLGGVIALVTRAVTMARRRRGLAPLATREGPQWTPWVRDRRGRLQ
ncbi:endonuclease domain-containing protein [Demequina muriae]|uniref:Type IV toxin-antitoxin system AbiEi family antitoxin domain-containing protein n=1 Tax=Demequina muriae TaxID=3051664 RepID=A0ABT8GG36_9MICO|nr:type IV toxin-antitoxin system AbiEi family antitoxin domain-containing protein [Demequina sp. EGI L300058]MDN4480324.1 type IV toxin-antitoxin system AbiEi family antitoxin domain-containing protein [Demequina sp. EGI L300058]